MPKEKSINPAQAQRKAEKAKAIKKGKAEAASRRNEKLARRNPSRLEKQLSELKELESSGGKLTANEKAQIETLERDLKAVKKAREALGDAAPKFGSGHGGGRGGNETRGGFGGNRGGRGGGVLGKRRRDEGESSEEDEVPEDVKRIPMPRDTPPPIPKEVLDKWYQKRREKMGHTNNNNGAPRGTNANNTPLGSNERITGRGNDRNASAPAPAPVMEVKTVYEAKPVIRDLRKEAVAFVPAAVRAKLEKSKGVGGLVEPEEMDKLEKAGYVAAMARRSEERGGSSERRVSDQPNSRSVMMEEVKDEDG